MYISRFLGLVAALALFPPVAKAADKPEPGFASLFDGMTLNGWTLVNKNGTGYVVTNGVIACEHGGGGNLFTDKEYSDFILRTEFKLEAGSNNGIGIRAPLEGDAAYMGMEIQVLDDTAPKYANLKPWQAHGSVYGVIASKRGALRPVGEWNQEEIACKGRHIKVTLNGKVIVDTNLNLVTDPDVLRKHPGMLRDRGHIGFLGHNDYVEFRNIRIKDLSAGENQLNHPPEGFKALFNGKDLSGWKGLAGDPPKRAKWSKEELAAEQAKADERMRSHWSVENGVIVFDGKGDSLCTSRDYADFEMLVDWKILEKGDSGIYLRGSPQVQIWEPNSPGQFSPVDGSGALYNNEKNSRHPLKFADKPIREWNRFRILMVGEKVHVFLNGELVVNDTTLENYWERNKPIYPAGQIELQNHGNHLYFKNIFIREIPPTAKN
jgi:hypothetical protein